MPFYLVTQTTLIEADNPQHAAQSAVDLIRSGIAVSVSVKHDQADISHVIVPAEAEAPSSNTCDATTTNEQTAQTVLPSEFSSKPARPGWISKMAKAVSIKTWRR